MWSPQTIIEKSFSSVLDLVLVLKSKRFMTTFEFMQWHRVVLNFAGYNFGIWEFFPRSVTKLQYRKIFSAKINSTREFIQTIIPSSLESCCCHLLKRSLWEEHLQFLTRAKQCNLRLSSASDNEITVFYISVLFHRSVTCSLIRVRDDGLARKSNLFFAIHNHLHNYLRVDCCQYFFLFSCQDCMGRPCRRLADVAELNGKRSNWFPGL